MTDETSAFAADFERDPRWVRDPTDGETKPHLVNREKGLRSFVESTATTDWSLEDRNNEGSYRITLALADSVVDAEVPILGDDMLSIKSSGLEQFWFNTPRGIQYACVVEEARDEGDELVLRFEVRGGSLAASDGHVTFYDGDGVERIWFDGLFAFDAGARDLTARFRAGDDGTLEIAVDTTDAAWPVTIDPIASSAIYRVGPEANSQFGAAMAAGDLNGDTYDDLVVGAPSFDSTESQASEGEVLIYLGTSSGMPSTPNSTIESNRAGAFFGSSVAIGDVNDDGDNDLVVGARRDDISGPATEGILRVFHGNGDGTFSAAADATLQVGISNCQLGGLGGTALGDVNGDGSMDVIARCSQGDHERLVVWHGGTNNSTMDNTPEFNQNIGENSSFTLAVSELDGNVFDDVVMSTLSGSDPVVMIIPGSSGGLNAGAAYELENSEMADCSNYVVTTCDLLGDGFPDIVVGCWDPLIDSDGRVALMLNDGGVIDDAGATILHGPNNSQDEFGSLVGCGDVNDDSWADLVICSNRYDANGNTTDSGKCQLYAVDPIAEDLVLKSEILGQHDSETLGRFSGGALVFADLSGDGADDWIVGTNLWGPSSADLTGRVLVLDGERANLKSASAAQIEGNATEAGLGEVLEIADLDSDGYGDLIAGMPNLDNGAPANGCVAVWRGGSGSSFNGTSDWSICGEGQDQFGAAIAVGKYRGTGYGRSLAVAETEWDSTGNNNRGRVLIFNAGAGSLPSQTDVDSYDQWIEGDDKGDVDQTFGASLANCTNLINTSGDCLAVGAPVKAGLAANGGEVLVYSSSGASGLNTSAPAATRSGASTGYSGVSCTESFGEYLANAGNVFDADASTPHDDLLVGAPECDLGSTNEGRIFLYSAASGGVLSATTWGYEANQTEARMGPVAGLGDVSGDNIDDFAVGAPLYNGGVTDSGRVYVFLGSNGTPSGSPNMTYTPSSATHAGTAIAGGGDVNLDLYNDFIIGEPTLSNGNTNEGRYTVIFGGPGGPPGGAPDYSKEGGGNYFVLGTGVAMGDLNGDGRADVAVGSPGYESGTTGEGRATVVFSEW